MVMSSMYAFLLYTMKLFYELMQYKGYISWITVNAEKISNFNKRNNYLAHINMEWIKHIALPYQN